ncbi:IclR family transcriptional regulator [Alteribacillus iranensis]|uniref:Glycerol operon regulatory protein n=1 Tax=Alteribacillus iranensis TaxID=930128 RepID=A0A1I2F118_9BACI|nr:IclR family transcriptional regulator [Alteribacillus iranensis]SFE99042.1 transcriptional regulator, IclR family [Alteribacillus iranensis]
MTTAEKKKYTSNSLVRGLEVLKLFNAERPTLSLAEIASHLGVSRTTPYRILYTLEELGYVSQDPESKRYALTPKVLELGFSYLKSLQLPELARPYLEKLRDFTGASSHMGVLQDNEIVYIVRAPSNRVSNVTINVGTRLPIYATSMGKCLLAHLTNEEREEFLTSSLLEPLTSSTKTGRDELKADLDDIQGKGYAISKGEFEEGIWSVACPILGKDNKVIAAINIAAPQHTIKEATFNEEIIPAVCDTAKEISALFKFSD